MKPTCIKVCWLLIAVVTVFVQGCTPQVVVSLDKSSWRPKGQGIIPSLEVDLVGINESEKSTWDQYPLSQYFSPNDQTRRDADRHTMTFSNDDPGNKTLTKSDEIRSKWKSKGAKWLFVLVNLPGVENDIVGEADPRRLILPLNDWPFGTKTIDIIVKSSIVLCTTPRKASE